MDRWDGTSPGAMGRGACARSVREITRAADAGTFLGATDTGDMDRERAETFLRRLAEAELRDPPVPPGHPARDGVAAVATALPEPAGMRLVLLGVYNSHGRTWMNALALGPMPDQRRALPGPNRYFPLSVWVRSSAGRWHIAKGSRRRRSRGWYPDRSGP